MARPLVAFNHVKAARAHLAVSRAGREVGLGVGVDVDVGVGVEVEVEVGVGVSEGVGGGPSPPPGCSFPALARSSARLKGKDPKVRGWDTPPSPTTLAAKKFLGPVKFVAIKEALQMRITTVRRVFKIGRGSAMAEMKALPGFQLNPRNQKETMG